MLEWPFSNIFCKNPMKRACFYEFLRKNQFLPIFYTQNGHYSIFVGSLTLRRHSDVSTLMVGIYFGTLLVD